MILDLIGKRIAVELDESSETTQGGIVIPAAARDQQQIGVAVAVSDEAPDSLRKGDRVLFNRHAGQEVKIDGKTLRILLIDDVFAVVRAGQ